MPFFGAAYLAWEYLAWFSAGTKLFVVDPLDLVDVGVKVSIAVFSIAAVVGTYLSSASTQRQRMKWAVIGISLGYSAIAGHDIMLSFGLFRGILQFVTWCFVLAAFLAPLSVAYAIARHRVIDVRFVLSRGFVYLILTLMLAAAMASTYWITNVFLQQAHVATLVQFPIAILVGVILMRLYSLDGVWNQSLVFPAALRSIATDFDAVRRTRSRRIIGRTRNARCIRAGHCVGPCRRRGLSANA